MARKKVIVAIEDIQPDTLRSESFKYLRNFICYEEHLGDNIEKSALRNIWNEDKIGCEKDRDIIIRNWNDSRKSLTFANDDIAAYDVKLTSKVKLSDEYIYRVRYMDYNNIANEVYCTYKEIFPQIDRKIKNKYAMVLYDGHREKIEYSDEAIGNIIQNMTPNTNSVIVYQIMRDNEEGEAIMITAYKNFLRK